MVENSSGTGWQHRYRWVLLIAAAALLMVGIGETLAGGRQSKSTREEILKRLTKEPDILINVGAYDIPSTGDLVLLGSRATPALVNCLVNNLDNYAREICAHVLVATRDSRAIAPLIAALEDPNYSVRHHAIRALSQIEARTATPRLLEFVEAEEGEEYMAGLAVEALGRSGDPDAVQPLLTYFGKSRTSAAQRALWDMRRHLTEAQIESLVTVPLNTPLKKLDSTVLGWALERAGDLKLSVAVDQMISLYPKTSYQVQNRIIYNLGRIGDPSAVPFLEGLVDLRGEARLLNNVIFALQRLGHDVTPLLRETITDKRAYIRYNAAFVAGDIREARLLKELQGALEDPNNIVRIEAAKALGRIGDAGSSKALEKASRDNNADVREAALVSLLSVDYAAYQETGLKALREEKSSGTRFALIQALGKGDIRPILPEIFITLNPDDYQDRSIGLEFLGRFDKLDLPEALAFLVRVAASGNHEAFKLLARFADERTAFLLEPWLAHPGGEGEQIMRALARLKIPERKALAKRFFESEGTIAQLYAAYYYAAIGDVEGMELLLTALEVAPLHFKRNVATILTELDFTAFNGAEERLVKLLAHSDAYVRLYAARPLAHRGLDSGVNHLRGEIDKKIPFIRDEVIDIVDRMPPTRRKEVLQAWASEVDPMLKSDLEAKLKR